MYVVYLKLPIQECLHKMCAAAKKFKKVCKAPSKNMLSIKVERLDIPLLFDFLHDLGARHFCRIASDPSHPLFDRICFNQGKMSLRRKATTYLPKRANTQKRAKFFFNF